jgi:hypothetical protein
MEGSRRFPPPWRIDKQALACVYSRDNEAEARQAKTADEARRIAITSRGSQSCSGKRIATSNVPIPLGKHQPSYLSIAPKFAWDANALALNRA